MEIMVFVCDWDDIGRDGGNSLADANVIDDDDDDDDDDDEFINTW